MSAQCYEHRFGYCTNAKTCFNVHFRPILAERRVLLGMNILRRDFRQLSSLCTYTGKQRDRQTDTTEIIYHAASRVVNKLSSPTTPIFESPLPEANQNSAVNNCYSASPGRSALCHQHCLSSLVIWRNLSLGANCRTLDGKQLTGSAQ